MEIQIIKDKKNTILKRREISFKIKEKVTPPRIDVKGKLAALLNSKPELIVIEHLDTLYGKQELIGVGCIYETEERLKQLAHQHLIARDAPKVKEGEAAPPAQAAPAAQPEGKK
ncbi:MAG: 30S ribosomal protein S24e [Candidatus Methanoperedens sp.]|nr:30S ribosomal protein S24e [Candidatus Methanoperedens sp.]